MKRILFYVAIMFGSLIAQAQPAVEFHDATAAIGDSVRIVPKFALGDSRSYLVTSTNYYNDQFEGSNSAEYRFTVESVDQDHYGIYLFMDKMQYEMPENILTTQAKMLLDMFHDKGFRFSINRNDLTVDSIFYTEFLDPFKVYLTTAFREMFGDKMEPEQMEREIEEGLNDDFLKRTVTELIQTMITPFTEQYGRTYAMGGSRWIEADEDLENTEVEDIDTDIQVEETITEEEGEEMTDFSMQEVHQAFAHINVDGTFFYQEKISWESLMLDNWSEHQEASFDANGWPIEITSTITMGNTSTSIHWQLIEKND